MSGVPYTFATATTSIPLSQLDVNFATPATLGNTTVGLGNTVTSVGNLTLVNTTVTTGNVTTDLTVHGLTVGLGGGSVSTATVVGNGALAATNTGVGTTAVGYQAGAANTSGANEYFGYQAGYANSTGSGSVFLGHQAGLAGADIDHTVAVGYQALSSISSGSADDNTAIGYLSLKSNTSGAFNTALGSNSLYNNTTASNNTAVGYEAGYINSTGGTNCFFGNQAGYTANSSNNTFIGAYAGYYVSSGANNTILGGYNGNQGGLDIRTASNYVVLSDGSGNPRAYHNGTNWYQSNNSTLWSITSDERIKKNITTNTDGLDKISQIQIRNFEYRLPTEIDSTLNQDLAVNITGTQLGVIAQELQAILPDCVTTQDSGILSVNASNVFWHLVTAVQQLSAQVTTQAAEIAALQAKVGA